MPVEIDYLADRPEFCDELAGWLHAEWDWFTPGSTLESRRQKVYAHLNRDELPLAVVAHDHGMPLGTAALRAEDMDTRRDLTPWMASVYVTPAVRSHGIGARLVARIESEARRLGFDTLYLVTFDKEPYYTARGWRPLDRTLYRKEPVVVMCRSLGSPATPQLPLELPPNCCSPDGRLRRMSSAPMTRPARTRALALGINTLLCQTSHG